MRRFFPIALVVVGLLALAWICYNASYVDPRVTEKQVTQVVDKLDGLYKNHESSSTEKRAIVFEEMFHEHRADFQHALLAHLSIAFFVAALLILSVDSITGSMTNREFREHANSVSQNVWNAIFNRLVPAQIAAEVERLLKSDVCRIRPQYTVTFPHNAYKNVPKGYVVVRRQLYYRLLNLTGAEVTYPVTIQVISHTPDHVVKTHDGKDITLPTICKIAINRKEVKIQDRLSFSHPVVLPRMDDGEGFEVFSEVEELLEVSDRALYVLNAPCFDLELSVINQNPNLIEVQSEKIHLTSGTSRLRETMPGKWICEGGILPGTALVVSWKPAQEKQGQSV
jgi:hypothetical protein